MDCSQQQQKKAALSSLSPSHTPRSADKYGRDIRPMDGYYSNGKCDKDKGVNIQVLLRCRPLNEDEAKSNIPVVISCNEHRREVSATQSIANKQIDRTFTFDKVFGPSSQQKDLFEQAVSPMVNEVLEGYNCTIFAYGQTGTGKTYTMEGNGKKSKNGDFPTDAGVIPRSVRQIFDILEAQNADYSMKVTFLELYNEEITDLLATEETSRFVDDKSKKPIALMEDGKGGVFVRGLEEEIVTSASEIYKVLDKGSAKRRTAETLLNKQSSRSHSIFSITIHIKECTPEGEEMIKCGKLNLVDLAGSENISRSGAREGRAREAGEINKSLLTLGRVINALVEHSGHIPYRDSKLTRLLRDSLGGKTKTCIIATISPSIHCLEETLSTLDYAHRAKNIKNKPEVNQRMMKSDLIKDLYGELDRLRQELSAAREKNGIYIPRDRFLVDEAEKKAMTEKIERLELDSESKDKQLVSFQKLYASQQQLAVDLAQKLEKTQKKLEDTEQMLFDLEGRYQQANNTIREKEFLITNLQQSEKALSEHALELRSELEHATSDVYGLFSKIERKDRIEENNRNIIHKFKRQLTEQLDILHKSIASSMANQEHQLKEMEEDMCLFVSTKSQATNELREQIDKLKMMYVTKVKSLDEVAGQFNDISHEVLGNLNSQMSKHSSSIKDYFSNASLEANTILEELQLGLCNQEIKLSAYAQQQKERFLGALETTRFISNVTIEFFETLDKHADKLCKIVEDSQIAQEEKLSKLKRKFEECAAAEEKQLLQKVAEMLASSNARKKKLVEEAIGSLHENASDKKSELLHEISSMQESARSTKKHWTTCTVEMEENYTANIASVDRGKDFIVEGLHDCMTKTKSSADNWKNLEESLISLETSNLASLDSTIRHGMEASFLLQEQFGSSVSATLEDVNAANENVQLSFENLLKLDQDACASASALITPYNLQMDQIRNSHNHKVNEIIQDAGNCLEQNYMMDEPSCSTPKRREYNLPSMSAIEDLKVPAFDELLKLFWDSKSKLSSPDFKQPISYDMQSPSPLKDQRLPLTAIN